MDQFHERLGRRSPYALTSHHLVHQRMASPLRQ